MATATKRKTNLKTDKAGTSGKEPLISLREAAEYLNCSIETIYRLVRQEKIKTWDVAGGRKTRVSVLDAYINTCEA